MPDTVVLIGFMGCGKTSLGKYAARALKMRFVDTDEEIEAQTGCSIPEIFEKQGEEEFRRLESEILQRCCMAGGQIVATGGGIVKNPENIKLLRRYGARTIWLKVSPEEVYARLELDESRPLLAGVQGTKRLERIRRMMQEREAMYRNAADAVFTEESIPREELGERFIRWLQAEIIQGEMG